MSRTILFTSNGHGTAFAHLLDEHQINSYLGTAKPSKVPIIVNGQTGVLEYNPLFKTNHNQIATDLRFAYQKQSNALEKEIFKIYGPIVVHIGIRLTEYLKLREKGANHHV